jgi:uncharacterized protein (TIGR02147 family)
MKPVSDLFQYTDYKNYLRNRVDSSEEKGIVRVMAEAVGCQRSYISQVMNGKVHLTKDQAWGLCEFWKLGSLEAEYFLLLVEHARAATRSYRAQMERDLERIRRSRDDLKSRMKREEIQNPKDAALYYSAWYHSAIHILLSIPGFHSPEAIAKKLGLSVKLVENCLENLKQLDLAKESLGKWQFEGKGIHITRKSSYVVFHHSNWRQRAVLSAQQEDENSIHFTNVQSVSREAYEELKNRLREFVDQANKLIEPSAEEKLICFNCDLFTV